MLIQRLQLFFLLTSVPQGVTAAAYDGNCTKYMNVDLYVLFELGGSTSVDNMKIGFQYVRNMITNNVDLRNTRLAFWTGDSCTYKDSNENIIDSNYNESCSVDIANRLYRFDFRKFDNLSREWRLTSIIAKLEEIENVTILNDDYMNGMQALNRGGSMLAGALWLDELRSMKRPAAELAVFALVFTNESENGDLAAAQDASNNLLMVIILNMVQGYIPPDLGWTYSRSVNQLTDIGDAGSVVKLICSKLFNCHHITNETVRVTAVCQWDVAGNCKKDFTRLNVILKPGRGCPPETISEPCAENACIATCEQNAAPWLPWLDCSATCGRFGSRYRRRMVSSLSRKCIDQRTEQCDAPFPCSTTVLRTKSTFSRPLPILTTEPKPTRAAAEPSSIKLWQVALGVIGLVVAVFLISMCITYCYRTTAVKDFGSDSDSINPYSKRPKGKIKFEVYDYGVHAAASHSSKTKLPKGKSFASSISSMRRSLLCKQLSKMTSFRTTGSIRKEKSVVVVRSVVRSPTKRKKVLATRAKMRASKSSSGSTTRITGSSLSL